MFEDDLYKVISRDIDNKTATFNIEINKEHHIFDGHFPDNAVMPGVCSLMIIRNLASEIIEKAMHYSQISDCKFVSAILPKECNLIEVRVSLIELDNDEYKINSTIHCLNTIMVKLKANIR